MGITDPFVLALAGSLVLALVVVLILFAAFGLLLAGSFDIREGSKPGFLRKRHCQERFDL